MGFAAAVEEERRLVILRLLAESGVANDSVLAKGLDAWGLVSSRDQVRTSLAWLAEQGLVETASIEGRYVRAEITERGAETARGIVAVPGVLRPTRRG